MVMVSDNVCPHCGQRMLIRHGVRLPPLCADLFDMIEHSGDRGVMCEVLAWVFYSGKSKRDAENCVRVNINRLNNWLPDNVRVRTDGKLGPYKVFST